MPDALLSHQSISDAHQTPQAQQHPGDAPRSHERQHEQPQPVHSVADAVDADERTLACALFVLPVQCRGRTMAGQQSRILAALGAATLTTDVPKAFAPAIKRTSSAPPTAAPKQRRPSATKVAPPLKATRSEPLPNAEPPAAAPVYSYRTVSPQPRRHFAKTDAQADDFVALLDLKSPISVDCEWAVNFRKGGGGPRPVSLIQIADKQNIILIQLRTEIKPMARFPRALRRVLEDATVPKAGVNILNDAKKIFKDYGIMMDGLVELGALARQADPACVHVFGSGKRLVSLANLVKRYLNKTLDKNSDVRLNNWEKVDLPERMREYAANDAYSGYQVFAHLLALAKASDITLDKNKFTSGISYPSLVAPEPTTTHPPEEELPPVPVLHLTQDMSEAGVKAYHLRAFRYWRLGKRSMTNMCHELRVDKDAGPLMPSTVISYVVTALTQWPHRPELGETLCMVFEDGGDRGMILAPSRVWPQVDSGRTPMAQNIDEVAAQFINYYYQTFDSNRANLASLYRDSSMLSFEGAQILGTNAIVEKLASLPFQKVEHKVTTKDAQPSSSSVASVLVSVTGMLVVDDSPNPLQFSQVFHLMPESGTYYVFNDIFRLNYA
uniref:Nuclear transport factor 2 n=1 Tax=Mycena chlorophos TaxID=658473 RepID=A0ABQ0MDG6_MYCCL|nr:nuclear transport factor 2 [Mycena chlorophos]